MVNDALAGELSLFITSVVTSSHVTNSLFLIGQKSAAHAQSIQNVARKIMLLRLRCPRRTISSRQRVRVRRRRGAAADARSPLISGKGPSRLFKGSTQRLIICECYTSPFPFTKEITKPLYLILLRSTLLRMSQAEAGRRAGK